jgi:hypothetical protein
MPESQSQKLISYIAPAAPATRRPAQGDEPFLRPEIGFTPRWYRESLDIDFGERWHTDPSYRQQTIIAMVGHLKKRFGSFARQGAPGFDRPPDLLTGTYGAGLVAAIYGVPIEYQPDNWPWSRHRYLSTEQLKRLEPPALDRNPAFGALMKQIEWIARETGRLEGYINWQGVLNNAYRLRGQDLFLDLADDPEMVRHLFDCVTSTMIEGAKHLYRCQKEAGVEIDHFTISNCLVNMVSARQYAEYLLPFDQRIAGEFRLIGIHNCAWKADPYLPEYAKIKNVAYIDMGMNSNLPLARTAFPEARRAIMYTPMDVANKPSGELKMDLERFAREYGPCDIVFADIDAGTPDERIAELFRLCEEISSRPENVQ